MSNLKIGNLQLENPFLLAPLAGITDAPFRKICRQMGAAMVYSEMVSAKGLWYRDKNTERLLEITTGEEPVAFQLFGSEPDIMAFAAEKLADRGNAVFDINMGCPVPKVVRNGEGSALMKNPQLVYDIVSAVSAKAQKPVTVKIRAGWDDNLVNAVEIAKAIEAGGGAAVAVHGRTRQQYYSGSANWSIISDVKKAVNIPVIGNGDVFDGKSAIDMMDMTGCDFVMVARGALGNPWIFRDLNAAWKGDEKPPAPSKEEKKAMIVHHFEDVLSLKGEYVAVREMRKHIGWYIKGMPGSAALRAKINQINCADDLKKAIMQL